MNRRLLLGGLTLVALISAGWGFRAWRDIHPRLATATYELKAGYSIELPAAWPKPSRVIYPPTICPMRSFPAAAVFTIAS